MRALLSESLQRVVVLAVVLGAGSAFAGGCFCKSETFSRFLLKKATKEEISQCEKDAPDPGDGPYKVNEDDALRCLGGARYWYVDNGEASPEPFRLAIEAFIARKQPRMILESQAYRDKALREKVRPLMVSTKNVELWDALVKAVDGDKAGFTQALYYYCDKYSVLAELLQYGQKETRLTLDQFWPLPPKMTVKQAQQRLKCAYGEQLLMSAATNSLEAELNPQHLPLLTAKQLRILRNVVYARHGRTFDSKDLKEYFSIHSWYRADPAYTDARLTPVDKRNLELIQQAEKTAR
ncbi:MAG TPA: YARHG domain-containing protein [Myxococcaceae bacterium]|jgi:hypothetical protein